MIRFRKFRSLAAALLVGVAILGSSTTAQAAYAVRVWDEGVIEFQRGTGVDIGVGSFMVVGNSLTFTSATTHFSITNGSGNSNQPGDPGGTNLGLSSNEQITATFGASGGDHTIKIEISQTGFLFPSGTPLDLQASAGGAIGNVKATTASPNHTLTVTSTFQGFLDNANGLFGMPILGSTPIATAVATRSTVGTRNLVFDLDPAENPLVPGGAPFSLTNSLTFRFVVGAGAGQDVANVSGTTTVNGPAAVTPAPAAAVLALTGLPILGLGNWLRRRRQVRLTTV